MVPYNIRKCAGASRPILYQDHAAHYGTPEEFERKNLQWSLTGRARAVADPTQLRALRQQAEAAMLVTHDQLRVALVTDDTALPSTKRPSAVSCWVGWRKWVEANCRRRVGTATEPTSTSKPTRSPLHSTAQTAAQMRAVDWSAPPAGAGTVLRRVGQLTRRLLLT